MSQVDGWISQVFSCVEGNDGSLNASNGKKMLRGMSNGVRYISEYFIWKNFTDKSILSAGITPPSQGMKKSRK